MRMVSCAPGSYMGIAAARGASTCFQSDPVELRPCCSCGGVLAINTVFMAISITISITNSSNFVLFLAKRAYDYMFKIIKARLRHGNGRETGDVPIPPGLDPVSTELSELALRFGRLASLNASTYGPFYDKLLEEQKTPAQ